MNISRNLLRNKKLKLLLILLSVVLAVFVVLQFFVLKTDLFFSIKMIIKGGYQDIIGIGTNIALRSTNPGTYLNSGMLYTGGVQARPFSIEVSNEKLLLILLVIVWLSGDKTWFKTVFSVYAVVLHFLTAIAITVSTITALIDGRDDRFFQAGIQTALLLLLFLMTYIWYRRNRERIRGGSNIINFNRTFTDNDLYLIILSLVYIILSGFVIQVFDFRLWTAFILNSSKWLLSLFSVGSEVVGDRLVGSGGIVEMSKACLGFHLMLLFVFVVVITGDNRRSRLIYLLSGVVILNVINILRFVFIFLHLQKYGDYQLAVEAHDLYNFITYVIVFLMWVLWIERYAYIRQR